MTSCAARDHQVARFLYREARLLDQRRFEAWLQLWTEDARYLIPARWIGPDHELRTAGPTELHILRADRMMLDLRVQKLTSGLAWAEEPASIMARNVSNIEVDGADDELRVRSNILLYRVRHDDEVELHAAARHDRLVPADDTWRIAERRVELAHGAFRAANLEFFL